MMFDIERKAPSRERVQQAKERATYSLKHYRGRVLKYIEIPTLLLFLFWLYSLLETKRLETSFGGVEMLAFYALVVFFAATLSFEVFLADTEGVENLDDARRLGVFVGLSFSFVETYICTLVLPLSEHEAGILITFVLSSAAAFLTPTFFIELRDEVDGYGRASPIRIASIKGIDSRVDAYIESVDNEALTKAEVSRLQNYFIYHDFFTGGYRFEDGKGTTVVSKDADCMLVITPKNNNTEGE